MVVQFFRLVIEGTDQTKLDSIKSWFDTKIENADLHNISIDKGIVRQKDLFIDDSKDYVFSIDLYIKYSVNKSKYKDFIIDRFKLLDKTGLTKAYIDKNDNCTHDTANPQPDIVSRVLEWNA